MSENKYISLCGNIIEENDSGAIHQNRGFLYGDGFFESMHWHQNNILFLYDHLERIKHGFNILHLDHLAIDFNKLIDEIKQLISLNKIVNDARIRLTFYRSSGGTYAPVTNNTEWLITVSPLSTIGFKLNENGLNISIFDEQKKTTSSISNIKSLNSLVSVLAGRFANENQLDDALLLNTSDYVIEGYNANLFIISKGELITPPLTDGCIDGMMRKQVIIIAEELKIPFSESSLTPSAIENADEIMLTNAIQGIRWVGKMRAKNYQNQIIKTIFSAFTNRISSGHPAW